MNRNKRYTKQPLKARTLSAGLLLLCALALCVACTAEPWREPTERDVLRVSLALPTQGVASRAGEVNDDERIDKVVVLVFNADGTKLETAKSITIRPSLDAEQTLWETQKVLLVGQIMKPTQAKRIYTLANWTLPANFAPDTYTEAALKAEYKQITALTDINGTNAYPIPMSGKVEVSNLATAGYRTEVKLTRLVAKVNATFSISAQVQNAQPNIRWKTAQMKLSVRNVPTRTFMIAPGSAALPAGSAYLNDDFRSMDIAPAANAQPTPPKQATASLTWSKAFYTTENPAASASNATPEDAAAAQATCLMMQLPYTENGVYVPDNYYLIYLKESTLPTPANPYKVMRNHAYAVNIAIMGKGSPIDALQPEGAITPTLTVTPWELADFEVEAKEEPVNSFSVSRTEVVYDGSEDVTQTVNITTNVADWCMVERATGNTVLDCSNNIGTGTAVTKGSFSYKVTGTAPNYVLTITKLNETDQTPQLFAFKAKNLAVPFKVQYDKSIIPSSVLAAAGWPTDKLPARGLQVATRGNKVLPGGTPEAEDPAVQWKTVTGATSGTNGGLGMGKSSTDAMIAANVPNGIQHPAANYCREMGVEWYLPSRDELLLIYTNCELLGSAYSFLTSGYYWSSMDYASSQYSMAVNFRNGGQNYGLKDSSYSVRCVRDI